jgi:PAS domain S-box-containing protein
VLNASQFVQRLRAIEPFGPRQVLALVLVSMITVTIVVALSSAQPAMWFLVIGEGLIAAIGGGLLHRMGQRAQVLGKRDAEQSQALLERLSIATQAAGIYCWELDWKTYAITWDESRLPAAEAAAASRRHFGVELGSDLFKWVHPDDQHAGGKAITESLARGEDHVSFRYRLVLPDGSIRHVQAFARTYSDTAGQPQRSLGVSWDVTTEVEAAERAARDASKERQLLERLSVASQAAGLQSWEFDFKQMKVTWLDLGAEQQDPTPEAIAAAGKAMFDQFLPEDLQAGIELTDAATKRRDPMVSRVSRRRDADGNLRYVQLYQRFIYDENGERLTALGASLDITESYQRQAELEALSIRFGIATRAANAGVWEWQEGGEKVWWNDTMYGIYGCPAETFQPSLPAVLAMIHPDDLAVAQAAWNESLQESIPMHVQFRIIRPDGTVVHLDSLAALITDSRTSQRRLIGIILDISRRVGAEQRERLLQKQLREASHQSGMAEVATGVLHNVGNVLNSLGVASSTVQARLKASPVDRVERVAAMLDAHQGALGEFLTNDPRGKRLPEYLSALGGQLKKEAEGLQEEVSAISGHVQYLCEIVQAQQSFARVGGAEEAVNVRELVDAALTLKGQELNGVEIRRDIGVMPEVWTDRYKLLQIIVNFIANACDAMAANAAGSRRIAIGAHIVQDQLEIVVEDCGAGIPADLLPRIWEFGFTTKAHGHGFGLHSSAVAAQQLGGTIAADSAGPGLGARFRVTLPVSAASDSARQAAG